LDRDGVYGSPRFHLAAKKVGLKAHIGAEVTCAAFSPPVHPLGCELRATSFEQTGCPQLAARSSQPRGGFRLPLLVASRTGYQNLCRLITKMKLRAGRKEGAFASDQDF